MPKRKYYLRYRRLSVKLDKNPRGPVCECCGKKSMKLQCHHWKYEYETKEVKKNPVLATHNTSTLCYYCHRLANALKFVLERIDYIRKLYKLVPKDMKVIRIKRENEMSKKKKR